MSSLLAKCTLQSIHSIIVERTTETRVAAGEYRSSRPNFPAHIGLKSKTQSRTIVPRRRDFWRSQASPVAPLILIGNPLKLIHRRHTPVHCMMRKHPQLGSDSQSNEIRSERGTYVAKKW